MIHVTKPRDDVQKAVVDYFAARLNIEGLGEAEQMNKQWVGDGTLDSFEILEAILNFEELFSIYFPTEEIMNVDFERLGGLVDTIVALRINSSS